MARILAENNFKVKLIDKRDHIGGNIFDSINKNNERFTNMVLIYYIVIKTHWH